MSIEDRLHKNDPPEMRLLLKLAGHDNLLFSKDRYRMYNKLRSMVSDAGFEFRSSGLKSTTYDVAKAS